jgi:hypothetical protein
MAWFNPSTTTVKITIIIACPLGPGACDSFDHTFSAEANAQLPLLLQEEQEIRQKLSEQLDAAIAKFMEAHKRV